MYFYLKFNRDHRPLNQLFIKIHSKYILIFTLWERFCTVQRILSTEFDVSKTSRQNWKFPYREISLKVNTRWNSPFHGCQQLMTCTMLRFDREQGHKRLSILLVIWNYRPWVRLCSTKWEVVRLFISAVKSNKGEVNQHASWTKNLWQKRRNCFPRIISPYL